MRVFVTKYALSMGDIEDIEVRQPLANSPDYVSRADGTYRGHRLGIDAFERREDAVVAANTARDKKIASLKKQIAKLEALRFE